MSTTPQQHSQFRGRRSARPLRGSRASALAQLPHNQNTHDQITSPVTGELTSLKQSEGLAGEGANFNLTPSPNPLLLGGGPICLEIGFGSGEHLLEQARRHPGIQFIGVEPFINGVSALLKDLAESDPGNIRIFTDDARFLLKALPDHSIARCFTLFADPWPKKRHHKRRIVNMETLTELARVLTPDGELYLATDDPGLQEWYEEIVPAHPAFTLHPAGGTTYTDRPADWPETRYEQKALENGRVPRYYHATLIGKA